MSVDVIATRRAEAVRALRDAGGFADEADDIMAPVCGFRDVATMIERVSRWVDGQYGNANDCAALHALALLLAAMTEPT